MKNKLPENLTEVIVDIFSKINRPITYDDGRIIWAMLANNSVFHKNNYPQNFNQNKQGRYGEDYSGSFRYNGAKIADAINQLTGSSYDYMDFYCSNATQQEVYEMKELFKTAGYEVVMDQQSGYYYIHDKMPEPLTPEQIEESFNNIIKILKKK